MYTLLSGLWKLWFSKDQYQVLILGLDDSGKTTLLEQLRHLYSNTASPQSMRIPPTVGLNVGVLDIDRHVKWRIWDLGGQAGLRVLWDKYFSECHALIYVIDCSIDRSIIDQVINDTRSSQPLIDRLMDCMLDCLNSRLDESLSELAKLLSDVELNEAPVLILSNKQDINQSINQAINQSVNAAQAKQFERAINQHINQSIKEICLIDQSNRPINIVEISALNGTGISGAVQWLNQAIKQSNRTKRLNERLK